MYDNEEHKVTVQASEGPTGHESATPIYCRTNTTTVVGDLASVADQATSAQFAVGKNNYGESYVFNLNYDLRLSGPVNTGPDSDDSDS